MQRERLQRGNGIRHPPVAYQIEQEIHGLFLPRSAQPAQDYIPQLGIASSIPIPPSAPRLPPAPAKPQRECGLLAGGLPPGPQKSGNEASPVVLPNGGWIRTPVPPPTLPDPHVGLQAQKQRRLVPLHLGQPPTASSRTVCALFGQCVHQCAEHGGSLNVRAGHQCEQTQTAQGTGGVFAPSPDRLQLDMARSPKKNSRFLVLAGP